MRDTQVRRYIPFPPYSSSMLTLASLSLFLVFTGTIPSWCPGSTTLVIPPLKLQSKAKPRLLSKPQLDTQNTSHLLTSRTGMNVDYVLFYCLFILVFILDFSFVSCIFFIYILLVYFISLFLFLFLFLFYSNRYVALQLRVFESTIRLLEPLLRSLQCQLRPRRTLPGNSSL